MPRSRHVIYATLLAIMGCGHSKSSSKGKKDRHKSNVREEEIPQKDSDDEDSGGSDVEEVHERANDMKTLTGRPNEIRLTLAQNIFRKLSCSQQNFFKMLDEKIENGKDYDDTDSFEKAAENARLASLLKDWETASAGSRSLESTPKKNTFHTPPIISKPPPIIITTASNTKVPEKRLYARQNTTPIPQSIIHQTYGVTPMSTMECGSTYVQSNSPHLPSSSAPAYHHPYSDYTYQAFTPLCATQLVNNHSPPLIRSNENHRVCGMRSAKPPSNGIPFDNNNCRSYNHPKPPPRKPYANGDLIQHQMQMEQVQYRQAKEMAQFRLLKEQQLVQQHQMQQQHGQVMMMRNYQSSIHIPMSVAQTYKEALSKNQIER